MIANSFRFLRELVHAFLTCFHVKLVLFFTFPILREENRPVTHLDKIFRTDLLLNHCFDVKTTVLGEISSNNTHVSMGLGEFPCLRFVRELCLFKFPKTFSNNLFEKHLQEH